MARVAHVTVLEDEVLDVAYLAADVQVHQVLYPLGDDLLDVGIGRVNNDVASGAP